MDISYFNAHHGSSSEMDLLGRGTIFLTPAGYNNIYNYFGVLCRTDECRKCHFVYRFSQLTAVIYACLKFLQFTCLSDDPCTNNFTTAKIEDLNDFDSHRRCALPQYISLSAAYAFITVSIFLRYRNNMYNLKKEVLKKSLSILLLPSTGYPFSSSQY